MDTQASVKDKIRDYITETAKYADVAGITDSASLIEAGVLDSLQLVRVVSFLEDTFGVTVADEEIVPKNFESIDGMEQLVLAKLASKGNGAAKTQATA
jgi:acyl carrier protein